MTEQITLSHRCLLPHGELRYGMAGEGPPVLLIMGFMARGSAWRDQIVGLTSSHQVVWFDHIGVGESSGKPARSMSTFVEHCEGLLDHLGWASAHVVGISMGGMIAQELALRHTHRVKSLSLIVTHAGGVFTALPPLRGIPYFLSAQLALSPHRRLAALKRLLVPERVLKTLPPGSVEGRLKEDFTPKPPLRVRLSHILAVLRHHTQHRLPSLTTQTLVVQAQEDLLISPRHSQQLADLLPHVHFVSFADAGHGIIRQRNIPLTDTLRDHLIKAHTG